MKLAWMKNFGSDWIHSVMSRGRSMIGVSLLQCWMVRVGVSQWPNGGWTNDQGTVVNSARS